MIPKILHYCWFGGKPLPESVKRHVDGWRKLLPDWEIMCWDESSFNPDNYIYSKEAMAMKSWAFVSDVCRMYALWHFGGVYLDTDLELITSLDSVLDNSTFLGVESDQLPGMAVIGAMPQTHWIGEFLKLYSKRHFINCFGHPTRTPNPILFSRYLTPKLNDSDRLTLYPSDVFYPIIDDEGRIYITPDTMAIHHYYASWRKKRNIITRLTTLARGFTVRWLKLT